LFNQIFLGLISLRNLAKKAISLTASKAKIGNIIGSNIKTTK
jgi:hypothetical protein